MGTDTAKYLCQLGEKNHFLSQIFKIYVVRPAYCAPYSRTHFTLPGCSLGYRAMRRYRVLASVKAVGTPGWQAAPPLLSQVGDVFDSTFREKVQYSSRSSRRDCMALRFSFNGMIASVSLTITRNNHPRGQLLIFVRAFSC
jgi:hypothetical protein